MLSGSHKEVNFCEYLLILFCFSKGLISVPRRALVQRCAKVKVYNLITLGSQHQGDVITITIRIVVPHPVLN